jgi:small subunit ribosomal protein S1
MSNPNLPEAPASEVESASSPQSAETETSLPAIAETPADPVEPFAEIEAARPETTLPPVIHETTVPAEAPVESPAESFDQVFAQFEAEHGRGRKTAAEGETRQLQGTVIAVTADAAYLDVGLKIEGMLPLAGSPPVNVGDKFPVSIKGRDSETGYYSLSRLKIAQPTDWSALERAFADKSTIVGTVTGVTKGGLTVDVGVRAFMPASRSGVRDAAEMEKLVGQEIVCRILKLDTADEDVVVDRRAVTEEEARVAKERRYAEVREGDVVSGEVRSLTEYGAFVDLGGVDGLLHVSDISWTRISAPGDVLTVGQQVEAKVLKIDSEKGRISLGMKQLLSHPWDGLAEKYKLGDRVRGLVTRTTDFGAFVELEPGVEGLVHVSEMSWIKKVRKPSDLVKPGDTVEVVILGIQAGERRMSLGLKQALGDPWADVAQRFPVGSQIEGPVTSMMKFGAFVELAEGVEGMIHVSEIDPDKRIATPHDVFRVGQVVKAQVIGVAADKRQIKLSIKQMIPTGLDEYLAEHNEGDRVTGRLLDDSGQVKIELGEGIFGTCKLPEIAPTESGASIGTVDLSALSTMLNNRWKTGTSSKKAAAAPAQIEAPRKGQIRSFRISSIDREKKTIELELV